MTTPTPEAITELWKVARARREAGPPSLGTVQARHAFTGDRALTVILPARLDKVVTPSGRTFVHLPVSDAVDLVTAIADRLAEWDQVDAGQAAADAQAAADQAELDRDEYHARMQQLRAML